MKTKPKEFRLFRSSVWSGLVSLFALGLSFGNAFAAGDFPGVPLLAPDNNSQALTLSNVVTDFQYDTRQDTAPTTWRTDATKGWYTETKDDAGDGVCDFQSGDGDGDPRLGVDVRCGTSEFPERVLVLATPAGIQIFDAETRKFWKTFPTITTGSAIVALNGKIYVGTSNEGVKVLDFAADTFGSALPNLPGLDVEDLDIKNIPAGDFLVVTTEDAISVGLADFASPETQAIPGALASGITSENKLLYTTGDATFLTNATIDALAGTAWAGPDPTLDRADVSSLVNFGEGTGQKISGDLVQTSVGTAKVIESDGAIFVQQFTTTFNTLPMRLTPAQNLLGHWVSSLSDVSSYKNDLTNVPNAAGESVVLTPTPFGTQFDFDRTDKYLVSASPNFKLTGDKLTAGMWVKRPSESGAGAYQKLLVHGSFGDAGAEADLDKRDYWMSAGENFFPYTAEMDPYFFGIRSSTAPEKAAYLDTMEKSRWQFLVGTYDGSDIKFYLDGDTKIDTISQTGILAGVDGDLRLGGGYGSENFEGSIALPFIGNIALTKDQVIMLYRATFGWFNRPPAPVLYELPATIDATNILTAWTQEGSVEGFWVERSTSPDFSSQLQTWGWSGPLVRGAFFSNLENGKTYYFRAKNHDLGAFESAWSNTVSTKIDTTLPHAGTVVNDLGPLTRAEAISFSWTGFSDIGGSLADHYEVQIATDPTFPASAIAFEDLAFVGPGTSVAINAEGDKTYFARVRLVDQAGNKSAWSVSQGTLRDTTTIETFQIKSLVCNIALPAQTLFWSPAVDTGAGIKGYQVYRQVDGGAETALLGSLTQELQYTDAPLENGHTYRYRVEATNNLDETFSTPTISFVTDAAVLEFQANIFATTDDVVLSWVEPTGMVDFAKYQIFRDGALIQEIPNPVTITYTDSSPKENGQVYKYQIKAVDSTGAEIKSSTGTHDVLVDKNPPVTVATGIADGQTYFAPVKIELSSTEDTFTQLFTPDGTCTGGGYYSGSRIFYNLDGAGEKEYAGPLYVVSAGAHVLEFFARHAAGTIELTQTINFTISGDSVLPGTLSVVAPVDPLAQNAFTKEGTLNFSVVGASGIPLVQVAFDQDGDHIHNNANFGNNGHGGTGGDFDFQAIDPAIPYVFSQDGWYDFRTVAMAGDGTMVVGNSTVIKVDRGAPILSSDVTNTKKQRDFIAHLFPLDPSGVASGVSGVNYSDDPTGVAALDKEGFAPLIPVDFDTGAFLLRYKSQDALHTQTSVDATRGTGLADVDSNGIPDWWETGYPAATDTDGLSSLQEFENQTSPDAADTDLDGILDDQEIADGTNPLDFYDHRFIKLAPGQPTDSKFTLLGTATPGATVKIKNGDVEMGSGVADALGRVFIELALPGQENPYSFVAQVLHPDETHIVQTDNVSVTVPVSPAVPPNPKVLSVETANFPEVSGAQNARLDVFGIWNGSLVFLGTGTADQPFENEAGGTEYKTRISLAFGFSVHRIVVVDQTNLLTSALTWTVPTRQIMGQVLDRETNLPVPLAQVRVTDEEGVITQGVADTNGNYSLLVSTQTSATVWFWKDGYYATVREIPSGIETLTVTEYLDRIPTQDGGLPSAKAKTQHWSGMQRGEITYPVTEGPTQTYEQSLAEAEKRNQGMAGKINKIINSAGEEIFAGYVPGKMGATGYARSESLFARMGSLFVRDERLARVEERLHAAAELTQCPQYTFTIMDFTDIDQKNPYYRAVTQTQSLRLLTSNYDHLFSPDDVITWEDLLYVALGAKCQSLANFDDLKTQNIPPLFNVPFDETNDQSRLYYMAYWNGLLDETFNPIDPPTHRKALEILAMSFNLPVDENATNTSFTDVGIDNDLAALLVAAKKVGIFDDLKKPTFRADASTRRAEFASWFVKLFEWNAAREKEEAQTIKKPVRTTEQAEKDALGQVLRRISREKNQNLGAYRNWRQEEEEREKLRSLSTPTRADWTPYDPTSGRAPIKDTNKGATIRRTDTEQKIYRGE